MKASSGRGASQAAEGGPSLEETDPSRTLHCKETLLSSSDTDDGDASYSKLVIDLDSTGPTASASAEPCPPADTKQPVPPPTTAEPGPMSSRADAKCRVSNAAPSSKYCKPSAELSNGGGSTQKGLKMKIRCSQSGGGRHEVSHFHHPVLGSPPPAAAAAEGGRSAAGKAGARAGSGSHRRDRALKDRARDRADRHPTPAAPPDGHLPPGAAGPPVAVSRDLSADAPKSASADAVDRDSTSTAAALLTSVSHDPYEFNASSEDSICCPAKKMKFEQVHDVLVK